MAYFSNQGQAIHSGAAGLGVSPSTIQGRGPSRMPYPRSRRSVRGLGGTAVQMKRGKWYKLMGVLVKPHTKNQINALAYELGYKLKNIRMTDKTFSAVFQAPETVKVDLPKVAWDAVKVYALTVTNQPAGVSGGPLMAYQDGSLGGLGQGPLKAFQDGSLGASGAGPLMSYQDGSLGSPLFMETHDGVQQLEEPVTIYHGSYADGGPLRAYRNGSLGRTGCGSCSGGLGQTPAAAPVLNLKDPKALKELKMAMASVVWLLPYFSDPNVANAIETDLKTGHWTATTTQIAAFWIGGYPTFALAHKPDLVKNPDGSLKSQEQILTEVSAHFSQPDLVPDAAAVLLIYLTSLDQITLAPGAFPILEAFSTAMMSSGGGDVLEPKVGGSVNASMAMFGGAAVLLGIAWVLTKK